MPLHRNLLRRTPTLTECTVKYKRAWYGWYTLGCEAWCYYSPLFSYRKWLHYWHENGADSSRYWSQFTQLIFGSDYAPNVVPQCGNIFCRSNATKMYLLVNIRFNLRRCNVLQLSECLAPLRRVCVSEYTIVSWYII